MKRTTVLSAALVLLSLYCVAGTASAQPRHEIAFPDLPGYHTLKCDFHSHTVFSDGYVWPTVRVDEAWREGLDVLAITDHIEYQPHKDDLPTNHMRSYELAAGRAGERDVLLIRGAEITRDTPPGHHNAIFLNDIDPLDTPEFFDVFEHATRQEAFIFWNHPDWKGVELGRWDETHDRLYEKKQLHGIEVCNGDHYDANAHRWALDKKLTMLGNSDIHHPSLDVARTPTEHRTLTLVFAKDRTLDGVRGALFARRSAVWYQNQLIGRESELTEMFAASVTVDPPHHRSSDRVWVKFRNRCELDIELKRVGKTGPGRINLPARATSLVRIDAPASELAKGLEYETLNFLIGPDQSLPVKLIVPDN